MNPSRYTEVSLELDLMQPFSCFVTISHARWILRTSAVLFHQLKDIGKGEYNKQFQVQLGLINRTAIASMYRKNWIMTHQSNP